jgi:hypothetical protein
VLPIWAGLNADVKTKKAISMMLIGQMAWAMFVAHGLASPSKMDE